MPSGTAPAPNPDELAAIDIINDRMQDTQVSRAELARRINRSAAQVSDILNGKKSMRWVDFNAICVALGLRTSEVVALSEVRALKKLAQGEAKS